MVMKKLKKLKEKISPNKLVLKDEGGSSEDYIELKDKSKNNSESAHIFVRYCVLDAFEDVKPILDFIREGYSVCIIKIKALKSKDINELKRAISKIKKVCEVMDGTVVGMDEDYLIVTPSFVKVSKGFGKK
ncbi:DUF552 domain-containing protein [archaeon]|nr:DUF552 domain-containing protein [archaeon]